MTGEGRSPPGEAPGGGEEGNEETAIRRLLQDRLTALEAAAHQSREARKPVELDQASVGRLSRMDALQMQAMAQAEERRRQRDIQRTQYALKRLDEGEYGFCQTCGEAIAPGRLAVDPTVLTCIGCASA